MQLNQTHSTNTEQAGRTLLNQMYSSLCSSFEPVSRAHSLNRKDRLWLPRKNLPNTPQELLFPMMPLCSGFGCCTRFVGQWSGIIVTQFAAMAIRT